MPDVLQRDFSGGIFRSVARELIPRNGVYDCVNGLLEEDGSVFRRGGSVYTADTAAGAAGLTMVWSGYLSAGLQSLVASPTALYQLTGGAPTNLGATTAFAVPGRVTVLNGVAYLPGGVTYNGTVVGAAAKLTPYYAAVANRLLAFSGDRMDFSGIGTPGTFGATDFHRVPGGVTTLGAIGLRDSAVWFTTGGIFLVSGLALNLTDATGNVQQRIDHYSHDLILWRDSGIAAWEGGLVVPARDAVWLVEVGVTSEAVRQFTRISGPIETLYRSYVAAGYAPGQATVFRGHYILPILNGTTVVDILVFRLAGGGWTRATGDMAALTRSEVTGRLLAACASVTSRVQSLSWFDPATAQTEADGSTATWTLTSKDHPVSDGRASTIQRLRIEYALSMAGGTAAIGASLPDLALTLTGGAPETGVEPSAFTWPVGKRKRFARVTLSSSDAAELLSLRGMTVFVRDSYRP